ncbi:hypothetical protein LTR53_015808, partial [Teratosphaeriaceae sp. CCFEE 6253]
SDEDEDDDDENLDLEAIERKLEQEGIARKASKPTKSKYDLPADLELSEDDADLTSESSEPRKAPALKSSAFVPSLSMGGYISGSGSDVEDIDEAPRKNRRGQRARQQIWEKKYGAKAQHLQKQKVDVKQSRDQGWDPKRGAMDGSARRSGRERRTEHVARGRPAKTSEVVGERHVEQVKPKHRDDGGALHPSWAAAKVAKEKKTAAPVAFAGKKITFD